MEAKTYTKRENAKRAAIAAGVPAEQVQITVHKSDGKVRFGWEERPTERNSPRGPSAGTANTLAAAIPKKWPVAPTGAEQREERNGIKRPRAGGLCAVVWQYLDDHASTTAKDIRAVAEAQSWNMNNTIIEYYQWRKFNGITKRAKVA